MIDIKHLSYAIRGNPILKDISLTFPRGKITGIIGPNGCGKSTLLAHVARLRPSRETIFIDGTPVETIPAADYARKLAVLAQRHLQMAAELSVRDVVLMGRYPYKERFQSYSPHDIEVAETVMQQFRILSMAEKKLAGSRARAPARLCRKGARTGTRGAAPRRADQPPRRKVQNLPHGGTAAI